jgi:UDP-N-acetyl-D-mannosaminuronic acid dehydrogenase
MNNFESIHSKIEDKSAIVGVIGLGQVGLPTALTFCEAGFAVLGHDINEELLQELENGQTPFFESGLEEILKNSLSKGKFHTEPQIENLVSKCDAIIICVATPISSEILPNLSFLSNVCNSLAHHKIEGKLILVESSIPPYTFENLVLTTLDKNHELGEKFWIAFVPERLAPGQAISEITTTPRVIGYKDNKSETLARLLYQNIVKSKIVTAPVRVAEISKLVENTYRDVNVALANEIAKICEIYGIDVEELRNVCNTHPRVNLLSPGPGVGGPCLPKDPHLLLNPEGSSSINSNLITEARKVNDSMPFHVLGRINKEFGEDTTGKTVTVLGVTYKANVSDTRYSPAIQIIPSLKQQGFKVEVYDPFSSETFGGEKISSLWDSLSHSSLLLILTDHSEFKSISLEKISQSMQNPVVFDCRSIFDKNQAEKIGIKYLGIGYNPNTD